VRDDVVGDRRLRYPVKLVDGQWQRISGTRQSTKSATAPGDPQQIRPGFRLLAGLSKFTNEAAYLNRKFAASGAPIPRTTRRASATRLRSPACPTPGVTGQ
jgi:formate dehydrogenase major subunit